MLVGLRWWHEVNEDGTSQWKFESLDAEGQKSVDAFEKRIFWWSSYLMPLLWILLGVVTLFRLKWSYLLLVVIALVMSISNTIGYFRASRDQRKQVDNIIGQVKGFQAVRNLI